MFSLHSAYGSEKAHQIKSVQLLQILYGISKMNSVGELMVNITEFFRIVFNMLGILKAFKGISFLC